MHAHIHIYRDAILCIYATTNDYIVFNPAHSHVRFLQYTQKEDQPIEF